MAPPSPRRNRRTLVIAAAAVTVVAVVIIGLALAGVLPWFKSPSSAGSFRSSLSAAQSVANGYHGGPWQAAVGAAIVPSATITVPFSATTFVNGLVGSGCTYTPIASTSGNLTIHGSDVSSGYSNAWLFIFRNASGGVLIVSDLNGGVTLQGTVGGSSCSMTGSGSFQAIPSNVIDSTTAASDANAAGGRAFLHAHPSANASLAVTGGVSVLGFSTGAVWLVLYSTCPLLAGTTTTVAAQFTAIIDAGSGSVIQSTNSSAASCGGFTGPGGGQTPIASSLAVGPPSETRAGSTYWYNFTIQSAGGGITFGNVLPQVQTPTGSIVPMGSSTIKVLSLSGSTVGSWSFATDTWTSGGSLAITNQNELVLSTSTSLSGDTLVLLGTGSFSGQLAVSIP